MDDAVAVFPAIEDLHERHYALTPAISTGYAEASAVCMQRHHTPPKAVSVRGDRGESRDYLMTWASPSERERAAWDNKLDATRDGAYGMVIAAAEAHLGLFVVTRAEQGTGSDYLFGPKPYDDESDGELDLEAPGLFRLEVSGIDECPSEAHLEARVREKIAQLKDGRSPLPGVAGVIAFSLAQIRFREL